MKTVLIAACLGVFGTVASAQEPAPVQSQAPKPKRGIPGAIWVNVGLNYARVDRSDENCFGWQGGLSIARGLLLRAQYSYISFENDDDSGTCDALLSGDSGIEERSILAGVVLGRSGLFVAAGPAATDVEKPTGPVLPGLEGQDTGTRIELGWKPGLARGLGSGGEIVLFKNDNEIRDYYGIAFSLDIGS